MEEDTLEFFLVEASRSEGLVYSPIVSAVLRVNETLTIFDPITGGSRILSFGLNWDRGLWQSAFNNALGFLGTGGIAWVEFVGERQLQVRFEGNWLGLNVPTMQAIPLIMHMDCK